MSASIRHNLSSQLVNALHHLTPTAFWDFPPFYVLLRTLYTNLNIPCSLGGWGIPCLLLLCPLERLAFCVKLQLSVCCLMLQSAPATLCPASNTRGGNCRVAERAKSLGWDKHRFESQLCHLLWAFALDTWPRWSCLFVCFFHLIGRLVPALKNSD